MSLRVRSCQEQRLIILCPPVHAYYALFSSLGFVSPLAAIALTPNAYLYGIGRPRKIKKKLINMDRDM